MMLEAAAAKRWGVDVSDVEAKNHEVIQKSTGKKLGYGELAADASTMGVPSNVSLEKTGAATPVSVVNFSMALRRLHPSRGCPLQAPG